MRILAAYLLFCLFYLGAAAIDLRQPQLLQPSPIDRAIPFLPWTIAVYLSQFVFLFLTLRWQRDARVYVPMAIATLISCAIFIFYPTTIARPPVDNAAFGALWLFDVPENCFPSLHVSLAIIAASYWPRRRWIGIAWAIAIAISTMTTKQHYFVDVAGGIVVGFLATLPLRDRRTTSSPPRASPAQSDAPHPRAPRE